MLLQKKVLETIRDVPDYPKPGILFKDITPVLAQPALIREIVADITRKFRPLKLDAIAAVEARGFIFGAILAAELDCAFVPVRKSGKLPFRTLSQDYALEYGSASVEMHEDGVQQGWKVMIHDDLLATGGTAAAAGSLVQRAGAEVVGFSFLVELAFLPGRTLLKNQFDIDPYSLVTY